MGIYLNPGAGAFEEAINSKIYIDKTGMINFLNDCLNTQQKYVCVSRPRRFGKSTAANMISAYYDKSVDGSIFNGYEISENDGMKYQGLFNVLHLNMQNFLSRTGSMSELLEYLNKRVGRDIRKGFMDQKLSEYDSLPELMEDIYGETGDKFVVVIDEWDCIFREEKNDSDAQKMYLDFLRDWLKDKPYIALAYMTGILPIKKYGTHSALNMFDEYSMENPGQLAEYVGFTTDEVTDLCNRYNMNLDDCRYWYDGYWFSSCGHIYNPRSIVKTMLDGTYDDYWNQTETFEALRIYIDMNMDGLHDKVEALMAGDQVVIDTSHFQNDMTTFEDADDVLTLLIHLGYVGYDREKSAIFIPNHELQIEFRAAMGRDKWAGVLSAINDSTKLLADTWNMDSDAVASGIEKAHQETSHLQYNDENALSYTVSLAYYAARQYYTIVRELPTGKGFADLTFIPRKKYPDKPAMVIELKWDQSADTAISQIKRKQYTDALQEYKGNILLVGISYDKQTKKHTCVIDEDMK